MGILDGLGNLGLGNLQKMDVYEEKKEQAEDKAEKKEEKKFQESSVLLDKSEVCPVCEAKFKTKIVRSGRFKMIGQDTDLRPKYQPLDILKYDAVVCPNCGYAALNRFFKFMMPSYAKAIQENITSNWKGMEQTGDFYTYDDAITQHKLALANTIVKGAKDSEKAYTCLKLAWLFRGKYESLEPGSENYEAQVKEAKAQERELLENAYAGFVNAYSTEDFPMCGMDELTVTYLLAELARRIGKLEEASRFVSTVLTNRNASDRIKERARDVKEMIMQVKEGKK